jgi:hypothetical protein
MRLLLISCVVVCAGLAASPAAAYYGSKRGYASCYCSFGYPGPSCIPLTRATLRAADAQSGVRVNVNNVILAAPTP